MKAWLMFLFLVLLLALTGCQKEATPAPAESALAVTSVRYFPGHSIVFEGISSLDGETCLLSQLMEDGKELDWWPSGDCQYARDGKINFQFSLVDGAEVHDLSSEVAYSLRVWQRGDESVNSGDFQFDIASP